MRAHRARVQFSRLISALVVLLLSWFNLTVSQAKEVPAEDSQANKHYRLDLGVGLGYSSLPHYLGSEQKHQFVVPWPYIYYRSDKVKVDRNRLTGILYQDDHQMLNLDLSAALPLDSEKNDARRGMPDLDWVGELGVSYNYFLTGNDNSANKSQVSLAVRKATALASDKFGDAGWVAEPQLSWRLRLDAAQVPGKLSLTGKLGLLFGDAHYHDYYYGVAPIYANADRRQYQASSGLTATKLSLGVSWRYQQYWLGSYIRYNNLNHAANLDSPLVKQKDSLLIGLAAAWIFTIH